ncbi:hypothetical protein CF15_06210 [Pyrodictium occultum]|uniref:Uncharacterized protein n=1 Tax=Pyrodictium occultum TaxID=2309 RepID=A0A0V8RWA5_PYROC|nr:hypothetical protein [Pyrodictium occultum]KSW12332.1 hypothetical protein CF15_06210 [Pyrodictium occultum]
MAGDGRVLLYVRRLNAAKILVVPKYISGPGPWRLPRLTSLRRVIGTYSPRGVASLSHLTDKEHLPYYGVEAPVYDMASHRGLVCSLRPPVENYINELDKISGGYWSLLAERLPGLLECGKPTGSLLTASIREFSDIDVVYVIDSSSCIKALEEHLESRVTPLPRSQLEEWALREARARSLPASTVARLYRPWARFILGRRTISFSAASWRLRWREERRIIHVTGGPLEVKLRLEPLSPGLADFPGIAETREGIQLIVYDGLFLPALYEGGVFRVRGLAATITLPGGDAEAVVVGVREALTFIEPL